MKFAFALIALLVDPSAALRVSPLATRRTAVVAGASLVPGLMLPQRAAHADSIEDIAARSNEIAKKEKEAKAKAAAQGDFLGDAAKGISGVVIPAAFFGVVGGAAFFASSITKKTDALDVFAESRQEKRRPLTAAEKKKYAGLSAKEKKELGIKGL